MLFRSCELRDEKNNGKTGDELKDIVVKNLAKDPLYYTKNGEFGTKGVGYTTEAPSLGTPKEPKGKHKSSGYGDLDTNKEIEKPKANVQDSLGEKEAKTSMPSKVKEMDVKPQNSKGVKKMPMPGKEKKIKLKEAYDSKAGLTKKEQDKISDLSKEEKKALYDDLTDAAADINDKDFKDKASYAKAMKDAKTQVYKKHGILENTDQIDQYVKDIEDNNWNFDEAEAYLMQQGVPSDSIRNILNYIFPIKADKDIPFQGMTEEIKWKRETLKENTTAEAFYQGRTIKPVAGGGVGGRRFIPNVTTLSKNAINAINKKGLTRQGWEKPHIKTISKGEEIKLLISKLLLDTIVFSQRGRYTASMSKSKMGTGISPIETSELSGEFKKLIKVLSAGDKLSQMGDYYLLEVPTKYNEDKNQYEMPLPSEVTENTLNEAYYTDDLEDAKEEAQRLSKEEGVTQHVNTRANGYEVSDWYDDERTVASYENGRSLNETDIYGIAGDSEKEKKAKKAAKGIKPKPIKEQKLRALIRQIIKEELNETESSVKKGDTLYHENSGATLEVTDVKPKTITMKVTKVEEKTPKYIKVGQVSKTGPAAIGKTYTKK